MIDTLKNPAREEIIEFPTLSTPEPAMRPLLYEQFLEIFNEEKCLPKQLRDYPHKSFGDESFIFNADSMELLKLLPTASVDSVICDPPYHINNDPKKKNRNSTKGIYGEEWDGGDIAFRPDIWRECLRVLKPGGHLLSFGYARNFVHMSIAVELAGFEIRDHMMWIFSSSMPRSYNTSNYVKKAIKKGLKQITNSSWGNIHTDSKITPEEFVQKYADHGTSLKQTYEAIVVARKPISEKSILENVLKWGVGLLNINKCRIHVTDKLNYENNMKANERSSLPEGAFINKYKGGYKKNGRSKDIPNGRFPGNILIGDDHDEEFNRFFFCSKPNKKERNEGLEDFKLDQNDETANTLSTYKTRCKNCHKLIFALDKYKCKCAIPIKDNSYKTNGNFHPTVKPQKLLSYLINLVTPIGGTVLDPFAGSSSLPMAALEKDQNFNFIAIEKNEDYFKLSVERCMARYNKIISIKQDQK